jgi:hypothetical protein
MLSASPEHFDRHCTRKERGQLHRRRLLARRAAEFVTDDGVGLPPVEPAHGPPDARASPNIQPIIPQTAASPGSASQPPTGRQCEFKGVSGDAHLSKIHDGNECVAFPATPAKPRYCWRAQLSFSNYNLNISFCGFLGIPKLGRRFPLVHNRRLKKFAHSKMRVRLQFRSTVGARCEHVRPRSARPPDAVSQTFPPPSSGRSSWQCHAASRGPAPAP